jgi:hypothetical protein
MAGAIQGSGIAAQVAGNSFSDLLLTATFTEDLLQINKWRNPGGLNLLDLRFKPPLPSLKIVTRMLCCGVSVSCFLQTHSPAKHWLSPNASP